MLINFFRVLITATDTSQNPARLKFFNNIDDSDLGRGILMHQNLLNIHMATVIYLSLSMVVLNSRD